MGAWSTGLSMGIYMRYVADLFHWVVGSRREYEFVSTIGESTSCSGAAVEDFDVGLRILTAICVDGIHWGSKSGVM